MKVVYAQEKFPIDSNIKSIFLAGPTPRNKNVLSWRKDILKYLEDLNFDGIVYSPEPINVEAYKNYDDQMEWEQKALDKSTIILFYIPRDLSLDENGKLKMPAFTTNIEFGLYAKSKKLVVCIPEDKLKVSSNTYIYKCCQKFDISFYYELDKAIQFIIERLNNIKLIQNDYIKTIQEKLNTSIEQLSKLMKMDDYYKQFTQLIGDSISDILDISYILEMIQKDYDIKAVLANLR